MTRPTPCWRKLSARAPDDVSLRAAAAKTAMLQSLVEPGLIDDCGGACRARPPAGPRRSQDRGPDGRGLPGRRSAGPHRGPGRTAAETLQPLGPRRPAGRGLAADGRPALPAALRLRPGGRLLDHRDAGRLARPEVLSGRPGRHAERLPRRADRRLRPDPRPRHADQAEPGRFERGLPCAPSTRRSTGRFASTWRGSGRGRIRYAAATGGAYRPLAAWSVKTLASAFHDNHLHEEGWFSSAFYVELPPAVEAEGRQGWIQFGETGFQTRPALPPEHYVKPDPGRFVLFPSYMWHGTMPVRRRRRATDHVSRFCSIIE